MTIVGIGPGPVEQITLEARDALLSVDKVFFRTACFPVYDWLKNQGKDVCSFDVLYETPLAGQSAIYEFMADAIVREAQLRGSCVFALPGNPGVLEDSTGYIKARAAAQGVATRIIPGVSFLDVIFPQFDINPLKLQIVLGNRVESGRLDPAKAALVCQIEGERARLSMNSLLAIYPPAHPVTVIWTPGPPDYRLDSKRVSLEELADAVPANSFASVYVPPHKG